MKDTACSQGLWMGICSALEYWQTEKVLFKMAFQTNQDDHVSQRYTEKEVRNIDLEIQRQSYTHERQETEMYSEPTGPLMWRILSCRIGSTHHVASILFLT